MHIHLFTYKFKKAYGISLKFNVCPRFNLLLRVCTPTPDYKFTPEKWLQIVYTSISLGFFVIYMDHKDTLYVLWIKVKLMRGSNGLTLLIFFY